MLVDLGMVWIGVFSFFREKRARSVQYFAKLLGMERRKAAEDQSGAGQEHRRSRAHTRPAEPESQEAKGHPGLECGSCTPDADCPAQGRGPKAYTKKSRILKC